MTHKQHGNVAVDVDGVGSYAGESVGGQAMRSVNTGHDA